MWRHSKKLVVALLVAVSFTAFGLQPAAAKFTRVAVSPIGAPLEVAAIGHGPRGCSRAQRRCKRRLRDSGLVGMRVGYVTIGGVIIR